MTALPTETGLYRKRPVVICAWQVPPDDGNPTSDVPAWVMDAVIKRTVQMTPGGGASIDTLEGTMRANVGDWIIRGVKGELYPIKDDIFRATYEASAGLAVAEVEGAVMSKEMRE